MTWSKLLDSYGFILRSLYDPLGSSKFWLPGPLMEGQKPLSFHLNYFTLCFEDEPCDLNDMRVRKL